MRRAEIPRRRPAQINAQERPVGGMGWLETEREEGRVSGPERPMSEMTGLGVRALIVVMKRGNSRGAKGGREVDSTKP